MLTLNIILSPIANEYREGKLKSTLTRGLKDLKSDSYKSATALRGCSVRFEERAREFTFVARLSFEAEAKASVKAR